MKENVMKLMFTLFLSIGILNIGTAQVAENKDSENKTAQQSENLCEQMVAKKLSRYIEYPEDAKFNEVEGVVVVRFATNQDSEVKSVRVLGKANKDLSEATIKAVHKMANRLYDGALAKNHVYRIPVNFTLLD